jgi:hypothetical protein
MGKNRCFTADNVRFNVKKGLGFSLNSAGCGGYICHSSKKA